MSLPPDSPTAALVSVLRSRLEGMAIRTEDLDLYRTDIYYTSPFAPLAVVTPQHATDVVRLVQVARSLGVSLATRGAGLSYSAGYLPANARTVVADLTAMTRITELNRSDRYVTVEAGVTWSQLREALLPHGLTTPFWGTFSGRHATIGASLAQGAKLYGSASRGSAAESVLGLKVVTGTGDIVTTGSAATAASPSPFFRNYGPDLTGLFLGDCGAFGIKIEATLQLVPAAGATDVCSYSFDDPVAQMEAMAAIGSELLATECLGMDPFSARMRMESEGLASDLRTLGQIVAGSRSLWAGLSDAGQIAFSGRRFARRMGYLMNCIVEGRDRGEARSRLRRVRKIASDAGGRAVPASVPRVMRAMPFPPMNGLLTPSGKRMNWLHTVVPNSRGGQCFRETEAVFERNAGLMKQHGIDRGYLLSTHGPTGVGVETLIRWPDAAYPIHTHFMTAAEKQKLKPRQANPEAQSAVAQLSKEILDAWGGMGGVHLQIGRKYPYLKSRLPETAALLRTLKEALDPDHVINPGNVFGIER